MVNFLVTTFADEAFDGGTLAEETADGSGLSLREAVALANLTVELDRIDFSISSARLEGTELTITNDLIINGNRIGDSKAEVTISGQDLSRIFNITGAGTDVELQSVTLTNGFSIANGGAILAGAGTTLDISKSTINGSSATLAGGALSASGATVTITDSLINGNTAGTDGGGVHLDGSGVTIINTTVDGNDANGDGGGIDADSGTLDVINSTITGNEADANGANADFGGGINNFGATVTIQNSVVAENINGDGDVADDLNGSAVANSSFFGTTVVLDAGSSGNINGGGDPALDALKDNGGPVETRNIEHNSPLLDAGDDSLVPAGVTDDSNGNPRISGSSVDIGATELNQTVVTTLADVVADDGLTSLREAVAEGGLVTFDPSLAGGTVTLGGSALVLDRDVIVDGDVDGDNKADITISGNDQSKIFDIPGPFSLEPDYVVTLLSLDLTNGFSDNTLLNGGGGAINIEQGARLIVSDSTIRDSHTLGQGGAINALGAPITIVNSLIVGNSADVRGGGINGSNSFARVINTTVHGNTTDGDGGGVFFAGSKFRVLNSTITQNHANADGTSTIFIGGLAALQTFNEEIFNSVIAENTTSTGFEPSDFAQSRAIVTNSFIGTAADLGNNATGNINGGGDPLLGDLLDNGGTVLTRSPLDGSQLIGAGSNSVLPADSTDLDEDGNFTEDLPLDARNGVRVVDGTVDIGAVEQIVDETIGGTDGNDRIVGGAGGDTLSGRGGADRLFGDQGNDELNGDGGDDNLIGSVGNDTLNGGEGDDTLRGNAGFDVLNGDAGDDVLFGDFNADILRGGDDNDTLNGGAGGDRLFGDAGNDIINGDNGNDGLVGSLGNDTLNGGEGNDTLRGNAGFDVLDGGGGNDALFGDFNSDTLSGGAGNDRLAGGAGQDNLSGDSGLDRLFGDDGNDTLDGGDGDDQLWGGLGNDTLNGGADNDTLRGNAGFDTLNGGAGDDTLSGDFNRDTLNGGEGSDQLFGGAGGDTFVFTDNAGGDTVNDWEDGLDVLDFSGVTSVTTIADLTIDTVSGTQTDISYDDGTGTVTLTVLSASPFSIDQSDVIL